MKKSSYEDYPVIEISDLKEMMLNSKKLYGERIAFYEKDKPGGTYEEITYKTLAEDIDNFGTAMMELGLENQNIAVIGESRYKWIVTYLSTVNGVGTIVPLDKELPINELEYLIERATVSAIIYSGKMEKPIKDIFKKYSFIKYIINMDASEDEDNNLSFDKLLEKGKDEINNNNKQFIEAKINPNEMKILLFTSGTTGLAKGVMLSHKNIVSNIIAVSKYVNTNEKDTFLSVLPIHHTYECTVGILSPIYQGSSVAFCEGLKHIVKNLKESKATLMLGVPLLYSSIYSKMMRKAEKEGSLKKLQKGIAINNGLKKIGIDKSKKLFSKIHEALGGNVRSFISGAAALDSQVGEFFRDIGIPIIEGYGLTECSPILSCNLDRLPLSGTVGLALPEVEVEINNPDDDGMGEIITKSDCVMLGYYKDEDATNEVIRDGWFYTGDLGYIDEKGYIRITGRQKNVIVTRNGKNIFPEEVELYLNKSDYIKEVIVWGDDNEKQGDVLVNAEIFPDHEYIAEKDEKYSKEQLKELMQEIIFNVNDKMPLYKRIRRFNIRDKEFEKTTTKKIKRFKEKLKGN